MTGSHRHEILIFERGARLYALLLGTGSGTCDLVLLVSSLSLIVELVVANN